MELKNIHKEKTYLLAVSGGIDSMVMAELFLKHELKFSVAHCNFSLRGEESDGDEILVRIWCDKNKIPFFVKRFETALYAKQHSISIQESARALRYAFFNELLKIHNIDFIATAHHRDDNIETVFFHFLRGTGIKGLTGIPEMNQHIVRPLLHIPKKEIVAYATEYSIEFRNDSSNKKDKYTRNKLRNTILPLITETFPSLNENMAGNIARFNEVNEIYQYAIAIITKKIIEKRGKDFYIPILKLKNSSPIQTITYELIKPFQFNFEQSIALLKLMESQTGSYVQSKTHKIIKNRDFFIITELNNTESEMVLIDAKDTVISCADFDLNFKALSEENRDTAKESLIEMIDADVLQYPLLLRKWRQGDYLYPLGMTKKKKVARVLIDAKISLPEKEKIWVLESDKKIVWIIGIKLDNRFKLHANTKNMLQVHCIKK